MPIYREDREWGRERQRWQLKVRSKKSQSGVQWGNTYNARDEVEFFFLELASRVTFRTGKWYRLKIRERNGSGGEGTTGNTESTRVPERFPCDFTCQRGRSNSPDPVRRGIILGRNTITDTRASVSLNARGRNPACHPLPISAETKRHDEEFPISFFFFFTLHEQSRRRFNLIAESV